MKTIVGFLSRSHVFNVLSNLICSTEYKLLRVYTHALNPKSQDPNRTIRSDYDLFLEICDKNNIPICAIDSKNYEINDCPDCDYIIEVSWRYLIPEHITKKARIAAFGIHRGKLPDYAGSEPIKQAILNNEHLITLSAHYLNNVIDKGDTISTLLHPVNYNHNESLDSNVQRLRDEITPLFSQLMQQTFQILNI